MSLANWIDFLDQAAKGEEEENGKNSSGEYYLKDWHLQSHLREQSTETTAPLYRVPPHFQYDLLNAFLTKFTKNGDYMFTYWGPAGSRTRLHSDVLNSFSLLISTLAFLPTAFSILAARVLNAPHCLHACSFSKIGSQE